MSQSSCGIARDSFRRVGETEGNGWCGDHVLAPRTLAGRSTGAWIDLEPRMGENPFDPAPVLVELEALRLTGTPQWTTLELSAGQAGK